MSAGQQLSVWFRFNNGLPTQRLPDSKPRVGKAS
jgi:hypothetical protein